MAKLYGASVADLYLDSDDPLFCRTRAKGYLLGRGWEIKAEGQIATGITLQDLAEGRERLDMWIRAKKDGLSCVIGAVPKEAENPEPLS